MESRSNEMLREKRRVNNLEHMILSIIQRYLKIRKHSTRLGNLKTREIIITYLKIVNINIFLKSCLPVLQFF